MNSLRGVQTIFRAIVCTVVPEASTLGEKEWSDVEALVGGALEKRPENLQRRVRIFLRFLQYLPVLRYAQPFTSLDAAQRAHFLTYLEDHPVRLIRVGFWGVRTLALLGYYGRPEAATAIGYAADARGWEALR